MAKITVQNDDDDDDDDYLEKQKDEVKVKMWVKQRIFFLI